MEFFFIITLWISIVGLASLLYVKHWELSTGRVVFGTVRPRIDHLSRALFFWIERILPTLLRVYSRRALNATLTFVHRASAKIVLYVEQLLERMLHTLRHKTNVPDGAGKASVFLREVAEHKKQLLRKE